MVPVRTILSLNVELPAGPPALFPCWNPALCDLGQLCVSVCLFAICASALQFSLASLMLSNKPSQSSRTKGEGKQSLHMKRGQRHQVRAPAEVLPSRAALLRA